MPKRSDDFISPLKPAEPEPVNISTPAPAWVALLAAWMGLIVLAASIVFVCLPGSHHPRAELEHARPFSLADRFLPIPIYGCAIAMFLGIVVIWQMRRTPRPLPTPMQMQKLQAKIGIGLALIGAIVIYVDVAIRGPKR